MASRMKNALWGFISDMGGTFVLTLITLLITPVILRFMSSSLYGFWIAALSILAYLGLMDIGLGISLMRKVASIPDHSDVEAVTKLISTAFFSLCIVGVLFLAGGMIISRYVPVWFKISALDRVEVIAAYRIMIFSGALALPLSTFYAVLTGIQKITINHNIRNASLIAGMVLSVILLFMGFGLKSLALGNLFSVVSGGTASYFILKKYLGKSVRISMLSCDRTLLKGLWSYGGYFQLGKVANLVATNADPIIIGMVLGSAAVTPYAITSKLAILLSIKIASKLPSSLFPALSQMFAKGETGKVIDSYVGLAYFSTRLAVVGSVFLIIFNSRFVTLWVGPKLYAGRGLNIVFVSWVFLDTIFRGTGVVVQASGDLRKWSGAAIAEAIINVVLSVMLIYPLGLIGVALGTTISRLLTNGIYIPLVFCKKMHFSVMELLKKGVVFPLLRSVPGVLLVVILAFTVKLDLNWYGLFFMAVVCLMTNILCFEGIYLARLFVKNGTVKIKDTFSLKYFLRQPNI